MYIPVFEIKDSFIIKNKLNYNTRCDGDLQDVPQKMMFIDYDLAKKSQTTNYENFTGITIDNSLINTTELILNYFDDNYIIYLDGNLFYQEVFNGTTVINNKSYTQYNFLSGSSFYGIDENVKIDIFINNTEMGSTLWEHTNNTNNIEYWFVSGLTSNGSQWISTGITNTIGYHSGITNWYVDEQEILLSYESKITQTGNTYIRVNKKIEDYMYNNFIKNYSNLYYKITSLNHSDKNYMNLGDKIKYSPYNKNFDVISTYNSVLLKPIHNIDDIYFNYDMLNIIQSGSSIYNYNFETKCIYNKYNIELFLKQLGYQSGDTIYHSGTTIVSSISGYTYGDYYMTLILNDTSFIEQYTYIEIETNLSNKYNVVVDYVSGNTIKIITPLNYVNGESVQSISNLYTIHDISYVIQKTYENYEQNEYRKHHIQTQKKIYNRYGDIINKKNYNFDLRLILSGLIYENENKIMILKIFNPVDFVDERLLYEPIEIVRIGKDKKTSIPITITEFTKGISADVIDENIYSVYLFDSNIADVLIIDANLT